MLFDEIWPRLTSDARAWLTEHNGEPLEPTVRAEILAVADNATDPSWWSGESVDGQTELSDQAVDWIEETANREDGKAH